jgi:hypothetical protein
LGIPGFIVMSIWVFLDLKEIESGNAKQVTLWPPLEFVYQHLGFWPAAVALPIAAVLCCLVFLNIIKKAKAKQD